MRSVVLLLGVTLAMLLVYVGAASAVDDVGHRDFSFDATNVQAPTGEKPQSKLWFNDGTWWASMFNRTVEEYHIYRYDRTTHTWGDTGTLIDERNAAKADTLWDGSHLYVATAGPCASCSPQSARLLRYSYDAVTKRYSLDPGFPVTGISNGGMEAIVLDKDTTGKLWVTYTQNRKVYVNRSLSTDQAWGTPFVLPVNGTSVTPDDISAVVAFDSQIGVMWSNQVDSAIYFATHKDSDPDSVWQASRTAIQGPNFADDHISLRSLQVDDVSGRVFAAVKTSLNDVPNPNPNAPLIFLMARDRDGNWTNHVFGRVGDNHTRPIVMIDEEHRNLYMFATTPCCDGGAIYYKKTALSNISFPGGEGTPIIQNATDTHINNVTSTKQSVNSATGLLVQASDDTSQYYVHNFIDLSNTSDITPPETTIDSGPSGTVNSSSATFHFSSSEPNSTFECSLDGAAYSACTSPEDYTNLSNGFHTFQVRATDGAGNVDATPASRTFSVDVLPPPPPADTTPPETAIDSGPSGTVNNSSASFAFSSDEAGSTFECKLDAGTFAPCTSSKAYVELSNGSHTFEVRATDAAGNSDATPASRTWTVDTTAPVVDGVAPVDGTTDVAPRSNVEVTFSEAMDPTTISGSTFTLLKQGTTTPVATAVSYDSANKKATLDPNADLDPSATYTATVKGGASGVKDLTGNPLGTDNSWSFSTAVASPPSSGSISIPSLGQATPYPATVNVSGLSGTITDLNVTLKGVSHTFPDDIEALLVGPGGQKVMLMSDVGGGADLDGVNLTFDDEAVGGLPDGQQITAGTYKPTRGNGGISITAPAGPYGASLSAFDGANPNGTYSLYIVDDAKNDSGQVLGGFSVDITSP